MLYVHSLTPQCTVDMTPYACVGCFQHTTIHRTQTAHILTYVAVIIVYELQSFRYTQLISDMLLIIRYIQLTIVTIVLLLRYVLHTDAVLMCARVASLTVERGVAL